MSETKRASWRKLDNAAKIFPATSGRADTRVFRFYCELQEEVDEGILQKALDKTVLKYPVFLSVMRKGLFWHYLEKSHLRPAVEAVLLKDLPLLFLHEIKTEKRRAWTLHFLKL